MQPLAERLSLFALDSLDVPAHQLSPALAEQLAQAHDREADAALARGDDLGLLYSAWRAAHYQEAVIHHRLKD